MMVSRHSKRLKTHFGMDMIDQRNTQILNQICFVEFGKLSAKVTIFLLTSSDFLVVPGGNSFSSRKLVVSVKPPDVVR